MMLGSKGLLPPTDANEKFRFELLRSKLLPQFCKHSESAGATSSCLAGSKFERFIVQARTAFEL